MKWQVTINTCNVGQWKSSSTCKCEEWLISNIQKKYKKSEISQKSRSTWTVLELDKLNKLNELNELNEIGELDELEFDAHELGALELELDDLDAICNEILQFLVWFFNFSKEKFSWQKSDAAVSKLELALDEQHGSFEPTVTD